MGKKRDAGEADLSASKEEAKMSKTGSSPGTKLVNVSMKLRQTSSTISQKMGEIFVSQTEAVDAINFQSCFIESVNTKISALNERDKEKQIQIDNLAQELRTTKDQLSKVNLQVDENTKEIKSCNMVINGITEKKDENCKEVALTFFRNLVTNYSIDKIRSAYRVGKESKDGEVSRALLVKFRDPEAKQEIMKRKGTLHKNKELGLTRVFCNDDLPEDKRVKRQELREIVKYASSIGYKNTRVSGDKLFCEGKIYQEDELHLLPRDLCMENVRTRMIGGKLGFFSKYSYLSNFHPAQLVVNNRKFDSAEQAYQYNKAIVCERE